VPVDKDRIEKYLAEIAAESKNLQDILQLPDESIVKEPNTIRSMKYSIIVIAEAMASALQHILAKSHNVVVEGYTDVFKKSKNFHLVSDELLSRLQPFIGFRNMLVHQYWRVEDQRFIKNLRDGIKDFQSFVKEIRKSVS
jgi:uncharacterized protein YutE (UPF0331/DUF86 family)